MNRFLTSLLCILSVGNLHAQTIKGTVTAGSQPVTAAGINLLQAKDSAWVQTALSNADGTFTFNNIPTGSYQLNVQALGYTTLWQPLTVTDSNTTVTLTLQPSSKALGEVTVSAKKPFIEMGQGKMIINVASGPNNNGTNALELLKRSPGVLVNANDNISMQGKQGVLVMVDGKETYLSGEELAAYLKTLASDQVAQIELITQPSAKYEAAGNAGIINIKLAKSKRRGTNGSVNTAFTQGQYLYNQNTAQLQHHAGKWGLLASATNINGASFATQQSDVTYIDPLSGNATGMQNLATRGVEYYHKYNMRTGADYACNSKTTIGASAFGMYHTNHNHNGLGSTQQDATAGTSTTRQNNDEQLHDVNLTGNAYLSYHKNEHTSLEINADGIYYNKAFQQQISSATHNAAGTPIGDSLVLHNAQPRTLSVASIKADYTTQWKAIAIEAGVKGSAVASNNIADYTILQAGTFQPDPTRTNHFLYHEQIAAAYIDGSKKLSAKWQAKAGLRAEDAFTQGRQLVGNITFSRSRLALFPTAYLDYQADTNNQLEFNYGRRVDRPDYTQLNPFRKYTWQFAYELGNPDLQPQYTHNIELKHTYKNVLVTTLAYSQATGSITQIQPIDPVTKNLYITYANVASGKTLSFASTLSKQWTKWFNGTFSAGVFYNSFKGQVAGQPAQGAGTGYYFSAEDQFSMGGSWAGECQYYYTSANQESVNSRAKATQWLGFGVSKKMFHDTTTIKLNVYDPFYLNQAGSIVTTPGYTENITSHFESRSCALSINYRFGKTGEQSATKHQNDGAAEEAKRIRM